VTKAHKTRLFVRLVQRDQSQSHSLGSQPADDLVINPVVGCHYNPQGLWLPSHSKTSPHITLRDDRVTSVNNVPNVIVWQLITSQSWLTPNSTGLNTVRYSRWFNRLQPSPSHNTQPMRRTLTHWPMVSSKATVGSTGLSKTYKHAVHYTESKVFSITTTLFSEISLGLFWKTPYFIKANSAWPSLCRLVEYQL